MQTNFRNAGISAVLLTLYLVFDLAEQLSEHVSNYLIKRSFNDDCLFARSFFPTRYLRDAS